MYKIIGGDQKEYGPVTTDELRRWIAEGRLNAQSLVLAEGGSGWKPLGLLPEFAAALSAQAASFPAAAATAAAVNPDVWRAQILARPARLRIGYCLGSSWNLLRANFGTLFGATLVVWLPQLVAFVAPLIGAAVLWLLKGVLMGGLYLIFLKRIRGQPASASEVFAGFALAFVQLMLAGAITALATLIGTLCCLILPGLYLFVAWIFTVPLVADKRLEFWSAMELSRRVATRVWLELFGLIVLVFIPYLLFYLLVEAGLCIKLVPTMQVIINSGAPDFAKLLPEIMQIAKTSLPFLLLLKFVFFLNLPFAVGALMYAYEDLFGTRTAPNA